MSSLEHAPIDAGRAAPRPRREDRGGTDDGLSHDYLAHLQHLVSLIARAATDPSLRQAVLAWQPESYRTFLARGEPGDAANRLRRYRRLDPIVRRAFEALITGFDGLAGEAAKKLAESADPSCDLAAPLRRMQVLLDRASALVEDGDALAAEAASRRMGRLYAR